MKRKAVVHCCESERCILFCFSMDLFTSVFCSQKKIRTTVFVNMYDISSGFANEVFLLMYRRVELLRMARELDVDPPNAVLGGSFLPFEPTRLGQGGAV